MGLAAISDILDNIQEKLTKYAGVIDSDHAYIHQRKANYVTGITGSISAGATTKFHFKTPTANNGKIIHWRPVGVYGLSAGVSAVMYKGSTSISGGSDATILNANDNGKTNASNMQAFKTGVTVGADGTFIQVLAGGSGGNAAGTAGGGSGADRELNLVADTDYTVTFTNTSGSVATLIAYTFWWYEEDKYNG